jgi:cytochrome c556
VTHADVEHTGEACSECHKKFRKESSIFSIFGG